jgi:hypothetical protein
MYFILYRNIVLPLLISSLVLFFSGSVSANDFVKDYSRVASEWESRTLRNCEIKISSYSVLPDGSKDPSTRQEYYFKANGNSILCTDDLSGRDPAKKKWSLIRPDGWYEIGRSAKADSYILELHDRKRNSAVTARGGNIPFVAQYCRVGFPIAELVADPGTKMLSRAPAQIPGSSQIVLECKWREKTVASHFTINDSDFSLRRYGYLEPDGTESAVVEFDRATTEIGEYFTGYTIRGKSDRGTLKVLTRFEVDFVRRASFPDSDFSLVAFDLPESTAYSPASSISTSTWFFAMAAVSGALLVLIRYLGRKKGPIHGQ